ncbi:molybdopterin dehydrogenase, FAD-binding protein [Rubrobacter xylanophilus DSM 9941]|uniref:Molybdopterin dehydrogenase, FAD-binding protein n=1 Tax=Rubrobacter xylanophilus (strain DSM 9941 / JCM 11954 / NBRC 16129 / PRD-1) TaxID=266117 RepID=Q1AS80_RUBXD|nr:xanthine dehydrogenase family protein subunit M [Rubrobacter xylanophilus]ABG05748.1 molybdopterin dehydrogenase, FAD-binding protein [Rubrobacter xylanophilus DSM 9941]
MEFVQPLDWEEALEVKASRPEARPIFGGTDVMVELNFGRARPEVVMDLTRVPELREWGEEDGRLRVGAGVTYTRIIEELKGRLPGLAMASRTVGSPQIRNRGTVGGNLGTASPAGDALPPLYVCGAEVEVASVRGVRRVPVEEFVTGPKRNALRDDELILSFVLPEAGGPQQYAKIGPRNAMVIAVCSLGLALHPERREVGVCIGSAGPTPIRAREAEGFIRGVLEEEDLWESRGRLGEPALARFGELVAGAARPISDVRGTAEYRRHAVGVLARRVLRWAWEEYREGR